MVTRCFSPPDKVGALLATAPVTLPFEAGGSRHSYHLYVVRSRDRDRLREHLRRRGIATSIHYPMPVHFQEAYRCLGYAAGDFREAERACREIVSLPLYPELKESELHAVASASNAFSTGSSRACDRSRQPPEPSTASPGARRSHAVSRVRHSRARGRS